jgi:uncharacterized protein (DUF2062 family)
MDDLKFCALLSSSKYLLDLQNLIGDIEKYIPIVFLDGGDFESCLRNYSHLIVIDSTACHPASDLPPLLDAVKHNPTNLIFGCDRDQNTSWTSTARLSKACGTFCVWLTTGKWIQESRPSMICYPVSAIESLHVTTREYYRGILPLTYCLWKNINIVEVSLSHLEGPSPRRPRKKLTHFVSNSVEILLLILQRLLLSQSARLELHAKDLKQGTYQEQARRILRIVSLQGSTSPKQISMCVALGVFCSILPLWGIQSVLALYLASYFSLSRTLVLFITNLTIPIIPLIMFGSLLVGHAMTTGEFTIPFTPETLPDDWKLNYLQNYILGSISLACLAGLLSGVFSYTVLSKFGNKE